MEVVRLESTEALQEEATVPKIAFDAVWKNFIAVVGRP